VNVKYVIAGGLVSSTIIMQVWFAPSNIMGLGLYRFKSTDKMEVTDVSVADVESERLGLLKAAFGYSMKHPGGVGFVSRKNLISRLSRFSDSVRYRVPHSHVGSYMVKYGLFFGTILLLIWHMVPMVQLFSHSFGNVELSNMTKFLLVGVLAYTIHSLFHSYFNWILWWIYFILCHKSYRFDKIRNE